jgi:hypothetical protein
MRLYVIWTAIYFPMTIYHFYQEGMSFLHQFAVFVRGFFLVGEQYNSWPLWYLLSTIYALVLILCMIKLKMNRKGLLIIGAVFLLVSLFVSWLGAYEGALPTFLSLFQKVVSKTIITGRILTGAFYIPMGIYLQRKQLPLPASVLFFLLGFGLNVIVKSDQISNLLIVMMSIGFFDLILALKLKDNSIYPLLRKMSTSVYFIHMYVWTAYYMIVYRTKTFGMDSFLITTLVSMFVSLAYCKTISFLKSCKA